MGTGTDIAMEAADVALVKGNLRSIAVAIELSRATMRVIRQNLFWAFAYNTCLFRLLSPLRRFHSCSRMHPSLRLQRWRSRR